MGKRSEIRHWSTMIGKLPPQTRVSRADGLSSHLSVSRDDGLFSHRAGITVIVEIMS